MRYGPDEGIARAIQNAGNSFAMATLNRGVAYRFTATDTRDVKSVYLNWSSISAPGTVTLRIETIDATTGKPSGSLYDSNATKAFTPTSGWQNVAFDSLPTTGLTAGTEYAVVLLTTTGGTTMNILCSQNTTSYRYFPVAVMTATDGTTRSNFALAFGVPVGTIVFEDDVEEHVGWAPYASFGGSAVFGTLGVGMKVVVPANLTLSVIGVEWCYMQINGTPAGDLRIRIFDSSDSQLSNASATIDKDSILSGAGARLRIRFPAAVTMAAGTYRIVFDSASSANSSNCWSIYTVVYRAAALAPSNFCYTSTSDITAGTISWTNTTNEVPPLGLVLGDMTASGGGGSGLLTHPGMTGGIRG